MMDFSARVVTQVCTESVEESTVDDSSAKNASKMPVLKQQCPQDSDGEKAEKGR
jgi:hypothetical protein|tara:strand:+ start:4650 stop:4811 length:162 start_codon:yes stop_codon:yes gene_type:complete